MRANQIKALILILIVIAMGDYVNATSMKRMDVTSLTENSTHVIHGKVEKITSAWSSDKKRITTEIEMRVLECVKGSSENIVTVVMPGGTVDGITTVVVGAPDFSIDQESVVFLSKMEKKVITEKDRYTLVGLSQGKFTVKFNEKKKVKEVFSDAIKTGMHILSDRSGNVDPVGGKQGIELEELVKTVKAVKIK